jgi:hypothetical protein
MKDKNNEVEKIVIASMLMMFFGLCFGIIFSESTHHDPYKTEEKQLKALRTMIDKQGFIMTESKLENLGEKQMGYNHIIFKIMKKSAREDGLLCFKGNCYEGVNLLMLSKGCGDCSVQITLFKFDEKTKQSDRVMYDTYLKDILEHNDLVKKKKSLGSLSRAALLDPTPIATYGGH